MQPSTFGLGLLFERGFQSWSWFLLRMSLYISCRSLKFFLCKWDSLINELLRRKVSSDPLFHPSWSFVLFMLWYTFIFNASAVYTIVPIIIYRFLLDHYYNDSHKFISLFHRSGNLHSFFSEAVRLYCIVHCALDWNWWLPRLRLVLMIFSVINFVSIGCISLLPQC